MSLLNYCRKHAWRAAGLALVAGVLAHQSALAEEISTPGGGLVVQLDPGQGAYSVQSQSPAWLFGGKLASPPTQVTKSSGSDSLGNFQQIGFHWLNGSLPMSGAIRLYNDTGVIQFSQTCEAATDLPPSPFPDFKQVPAGLHVFSYGHHEFAPPHFSAVQISTPWLLFDDSANSFLISPASHFMVASMLGDGHTEVGSGFNPNLRGIPAGFTQQTLVVLNHGINHAWQRWGQSMLALQQATRPGNDADTVLKYLGYWTDNGAFYYYHYDLAKGYAQTLQDLVTRYREEQIPIRYMQLDSWWYYKSTTDVDGTPGRDKKSDALPFGEWNRYGGLLEYKAHSYLFPNGLDSFQQAINLPLVTHNRWIDPASPYHQKYQISGVAAVDPKWWDDIADYLKTSGIATYEQDWLDRIYTYSPAFSSNVLTGETFLDNMARACAEKGITVQYCMPYPSYFMQGSRYPNLTTIRTSEDRFNTNKWNDFLYTSRLADSLGIWPWADVYMSGEINNLLLSTLSAGPVGIGDAMGTENKANLLQAVRADGMIVKPDAPIVPLDASYIADAQKRPAPLEASTYTERDGVKTVYFFAFNRPKTPSGQVSFTSHELGLTGPVFVYDYFAGTGQRLDASDIYTKPLAKNASTFLVVAPVGKSGIAFLGDKQKFVGTGKERVTSLRDEPGQLTIELAMAEKENTVTLHGFALSEPELTVISGMDDALKYDPASGYFSVTLKVDQSTPVDYSSADPVRLMTVVLKTSVK